MHCIHAANTGHATQLAIYEEVSQTTPRHLQKEKHYSTTQSSVSWLSMHAGQGCHTMASHSTAIYQSHQSSLRSMKGMWAALHTCFILFALRLACCSPGRYRFLRCTNTLRFSLGGPTHIPRPNGRLVIPKKHQVNIYGLFRLSEVCSLDKQFTIASVSTLTR
jgi:hypothetical protein